MDWTTFAAFDSHTIHARSRQADLLAEAEGQRRLNQLVSAESTDRLTTRLMAAAQRATAAIIRRMPELSEDRARPFEVTVR